MVLPGIDCAEGYALRAAREGELSTLVAIDDEASTLYAHFGIHIALEKDHPFVVNEASRWARSIARGCAIVAVENDDLPVGFVTMGEVDGEPYVDQLAVRPSHMRQGIGTALLGEAIAGHCSGSLWLTTYSHVPWNRPFYERHGFVSVRDEHCGSELAAILQVQRATLPDPGQRIAMVRRRTGQGAAQQPVGAGGYR